MRNDQGIFNPPPRIKVRADPVAGGFLVGIDPRGPQVWGLI